MLLQVRDLTKIFHVRNGGQVRAVDGVTLGIRLGENLGIVGESGCGKTTLARILMGLVRPDHGEVLWQGENVWGVRERERDFRRNVRMVFQDPFASLDPRFSVQGILDEALVLDRDPGRMHKIEKMSLALRDVGLSADVLGRYPHEFSGGERQRIAIARALISSPKLLVLDEAVSALDVLIQREVIDLLLNIQRQRAVTYLFISHDLKAVRKIAHTIAVMYQGKIVEYGSVAHIMEDPRHRYTRRLLSAALDYQAGEQTEDLSVTDGRLVDIGAGHEVLSC